MSRVKVAASLALLSSVINSLPNQFDTYVGENGCNLSGGQRQQLASLGPCTKTKDTCPRRICQWFR